MFTRSIHPKSAAPKWNISHVDGLYPINRGRGATLLSCMLVSLCLPFWFFPISAQSLIYMPISLLFMLSSLTTNFPMWYRVRGAQMG